MQYVENCKHEYVVHIKNALTTKVKKIVSCPSSVVLDVVKLLRMRENFDFSAIYKC